MNDLQDGALTDFYQLSISNFIGNRNLMLSEGVKCEDCFGLLVVLLEFLRRRSGK